MKEKLKNSGGKSYCFMLFNEETHRFHSIAEIQTNRIISSSISQKVEFTASSINFTQKKERKGNQAYHHFLDI
jgi:hypothetical protein